MNILVVNDDGIQSEGIFQLVKALAEVADVYVCAPDGQRSAKSHSVTLGESVMIKEVSFPYAKEAYQISGTPADCTKIGLQFFKDAGVAIDMVYSGINLGSNLGRDTLYSGTVGAAAEAALGNYHAVAVSANSHNATHFEAAGKTAVAVIDKIYGKISTSVVININVPDLPEEEIRGIRFTPLGNRYYDDRFHLMEDGNYELSGNPSPAADHPEDSDVAALHDNYISITPLQFDFTDYRTLNKVKEWKF